MNEPKFPTVIIGAGFVGLFAALHLSHHLYPAPIILVDKNDRFCFKPLLYEYLSGEMLSDQVVPLYESLLQGSNVAFVQGIVQAIDLQKRQVQLADGTLYDYSNLILAPGSVPAFFAEGAKENAITFQSQADAEALKRRIQDCLQRAAQSNDAEERHRLLTTVIVGGGPTGVELSETLGDLVPQWYAELGKQPDELRIVLLNRGDILSGDINSRLGTIAKQAFKQRIVPVELLIGASVTRIRPNAVEFTRNDQPEQIEAGTIIWTAGTSVNPLIKTLSIAETHRTKRGQLHVTLTLQLPDYPEVFAAGDCAVIINPDGTTQSLPATAQVAYQQGATIAHNVRAQILPLLHPKPAHVTIRGTLMKLGLGTGVANLFNRYEIAGKAGQLIRQAAYLEMLPTPIHDFNVTREWLREELFHRHTPFSQSLQVKQQ